MTIARRLLPAVTLLGLTLPAMAEPAMWEVRDANSSLWLFGSIHVLPEGVEWRTELFDSVLAGADKVVFETDIRPAAIAQLGAVAFVRGMYVDGSLLTDALSDAEEQLLREQATALGVPIGPLLAMRPWMAAGTISTQALTGQGYSAQGVEFSVQPEVSDDRLGFLEAGEEQLDVLASGPDEEQVAMLMGTLELLPLMPKILEKMLRSWIEGRPEDLEQLFVTEMGGHEAAFLDRLLYARNRNWIAPLEAMLDGDEENLVIVGAAHLMGKDNVLELLEQAGYAIERVQ